jgi:transcription termination/antitermination protein NusG
MPDDVLSTETTPPAPTAGEPQPAEPAPPEPAPADALPPPEAQEPAAQPQPEPEPSPTPPNPDVELKAEPPKPHKRGKTAKGKDEEPVPEPESPKPDSNKRWYAVKVQSGREESIKDAIERRVKIEGLEEYYGQILIPVERVQEIKNGKRVIKERKKFPGYLMAEVEYNDRILYLFRETSGVGDFVGGSINRPPPPLPQREIERMLGGPPGKEPGKEVPEKPAFEKGDRVKVKDGIFAGMEGEVKDILEAKGQVRVELTIFGRPTSVELEYWQVEQL